MYLLLPLVKILLSLGGVAAQLVLVEKVEDVLARLDLAMFRKFALGRLRLLFHFLEKFLRDCIAINLLLMK